jgi:hypothetical protein
MEQDGSCTRLPSHSLRPLQSTPYPPALVCHSPVPPTRELFRVYSSRCCNVARSSLASLYKTRASPAPSCPVMCGALTVQTGSVRSSASSCMKANTRDQARGHCSGWDLPRSSIRYGTQTNSAAWRAAAAAAAVPPLYTSQQTCSTPCHVGCMPRMFFEWYHQSLIQAHVW